MATKLLLVLLVALCAFAAVPNCKAAADAGAELVEQLVKQVGDLDQNEGEETLIAQTRAKFAKVFEGMMEIASRESGGLALAEFYSRVGKPISETCEKLTSTLSHDAPEVCIFVPSGYDKDLKINKFVFMPVIEDSTVIHAIATRLGVSGNLHENKEYTRQQVEDVAELVFMDHFHQIFNVDDVTAIRMGTQTIVDICLEGDARFGLIYMSEAGYPFDDDQLGKKLIVTEKTCQILQDNYIEPKVLGNESQQASGNEKKVKTSKGTWFGKLKRKLLCSSKKCLGN